MTTYAGGGAEIKNVFYGTTPAKRMYLRDVIIWMPKAPGNVPIVGGLPDLTVEFTNPGSYTYTIPLWANRIDTVVLGGGQGGSDGVLFLTGSGGNAGKWAGHTIQIEGVPATTLTLDVVVGAGGPNKPGLEGMAARLGGLSTVTGAGLQATTSTSDLTDLSSMPGKSPGNFTYNGITYHGGAAQNSANQPGHAPGGGGCGGGFNHKAGVGAPGAVWIRAYQQL